MQLYRCTHVSNQLSNANKPGRHSLGTTSASWSLWDDSLASSHPRRTNRSKDIRRCVDYDASTGNTILRAPVILHVMASTTVKPKWRTRCGRPKVRTGCITCKFVPVALASQTSYTTAEAASGIAVFLSSRSSQAIFEFLNYLRKLLP